MPMSTISALNQVDEANHACLSEPKVICELTPILSNPPQGTVFILDIDKHILRNPVNKYGGVAPVLTEKSIPNALKAAMDANSLIVLVTARKEERHEQTVEQLKALNISYSDLLYAPNDKSTGINISTKGTVSVSLLLKKIDEQGVKIKSIVASDDTLDNLTSLQEVLSKDNILKAIPLHLYHYQPHTKLLEDNSGDFPDTLDNLERDKQKILKGGTKSTFLVKDTSNGKQYVLKAGANEEQIRMEILTNVIYKHLGVPTMSIQAYSAVPKTLAKALGFSHTARVVQLAKYIASSDETKKPLADNWLLEQISPHFVVHAVVGNTDQKSANYLLREQASYADSELNDDTDIEPEAVVENLLEKHCIHKLASLITLVGKQLGMDDGLINNISQIFSSRIDSLVQRYDMRPQISAKRDKRVIINRTAAGVLTLCRDKNDRLQVLLAKRTGHNWYDNFGGKSNEEDEILVKTAMREVSEESSYQLQYSESQLARSPFHDLVSRRMGEPFLYRMYIVEDQIRIDTNEIKDKEHTDYQWVSLEDLIAAVQSDKRVDEESIDTICLTENDNTIIIYPPLFHMLSQPAVQASLQGFLDRNHRVTATLSNVDYGGNETSPYRSLITPKVTRADVIQVLVRKGGMLAGIKEGAKHAESIKPKQCAVTSDDVDPDNKYSASELHLKRVLGDKFNCANHALAENIKLFIEMYVNKYEKDKHKKQCLAEIAHEMILRERENPDKIYFYHGVNDMVHYAYTVYSAIYQRLMADNTQDVFRTDNRTFYDVFKTNNPAHHDLPGIWDFIGRLSRDNSGQWNNYIEGYMECVLSTNVFLFGNHEVNISNTVWYFLNNKVKKHLTLENIFLTSLAPMGVSRENISQLVKYYQHFPERGRGTLYQLGLTKEQARNHAYPARSLGQEFCMSSQSQERLFMDNMMSWLQNISEQEIKELQARVMLPPDVIVEVHKASIGDVDDGLTSHDTYEKALYPLIERVTCDAIEATNPRSPINRYLALTRYSRSLMGEAVGCHIDNFEYHDAVNSYQDLLRALNWLSANDCLAFAKNYLDLVTSTSELVGVLKKISRKDRLSYAILQIDKVKDYREFLRVLIILQESDRLEYATQQADKVNDFAEICTVLKCLPENAILEYAACQVDKTHGYCEFHSVLKCLPDNYRLEYAILQKDEVNDYRELSCTLKTLQKCDRLEYATKRADRVNGSEELCAVLKLLPANARLEYAACHAGRVHDNCGLCMILRCLPENARLEYAILQVDKVSDSDYSELCYVLFTLQKSDRLEYVTRQAGKVKSISEVSVIMSYLHRNDRLEYANQHVDKVNNFSDFREILANLQQKSDCLKYAILQADIVNSEHEFGIVLYLLQESDRLEYAIKQADKIINNGIYESVLEKLPMSDRENYESHVNALYEIAPTALSRQRLILS